MRKTVNLAGEGTADDPRRPNLPEGVSFTIVEQLDDGRVIVEYEDPKEGEALRVAARLVVADKVKAATATDAEVATIAPLFDPWDVGIPVKVGEVYQWDGTLVEVLQDHTTQADWTPNLVPALFKVHRTDDGTGPIAWQAGISVTAGEQVTYNGVTYNVVQSHTTQAGWEPPSVPSLFTPAA